MSELKTLNDLEKFAPEDPYCCMDTLKKTKDKIPKFKIGDKMKNEKICCGKKIYKYADFICGENNCECIDCQRKNGGTA